MGISLSACIMIQSRGTEKVISRSIQNTQNMKEIFLATLTAVYCFAWMTALSKKTAVSLLFQGILQHPTTPSRC